MIERTRHQSRVEALLEDAPVVAVLGARQVGKTTLARQIASDRGATYFDLESAADVAKLAEPALTLGRLEGLVVLDEIHRRPELFPELRVLVDRPGVPARFLVLGSAAPDLLRQSSETLAGRIAFHPLPGLALDEIGADGLDRLWLRGGFPSAYLARDDGRSARWRADFIATFLERDLPGFGFRVPPETMRRFWTMLAHLHGQVWNAAELGRAMGVAEKTVRRYLDALVGTYVVRRLDPWFENIAKRQVKAPKVYLTDSGLVHALLGLPTLEDVLAHPKAGASWEGLLIDQIAQRLDARAGECHFWGLHSGAELDLLFVRGRRRIGFEVKRTNAPKVTASMRSAIETLRLDRLDVVHAGEDTFPLAEGVRAVAARRLWEDIPPP